MGASQNCDGGSEMYTTITVLPTMSFSHLVWNGVVYLKHCSFNAVCSESSKLVWLAPAECRPACGCCGPFIFLANHSAQIHELKLFGWLKEMLARLSIASASQYAPTTRSWTLKTLLKLESLFCAYNCWTSSLQFPFQQSSTAEATLPTFYSQRSP